MNHVFTVLRNQGILQYSKDCSVGREKAYILSEQGKEYATPFLDSLDMVESRAIALLGEERLEQLTELLLQYDGALTKALEEKRQK